MMRDTRLGSSRIFPGKPREVDMCTVKGYVSTDTADGFGDTGFAELHMNVPVGLA
jgi:hypothetical protein